MAQKVTTHLVDDLTGDTIDEGKDRTVSFSFDGNHYEIDLSDDNAEELREAFSDYVAAARKVSGRQSRASGGSAPKRGNSDELAKIREWANTNGHEVSSRGRISHPRRLRRRTLTLCAEPAGSLLGCRPTSFSLTGAPVLTESALQPRARRTGQIDQPRACHVHLIDHRPF